MISGLSTTARGLLWVALAGLLFVGFIAIIRHIGNQLHPLEAAFIRYALGIVILTPLFLRRGTALLKTRQLKQHALRGAAHGTGVMLWFYAATQLPIAEVTALGYIAPIFVAAGAAVFLGERLTLIRIAAILVGICGVLLILRPGAASIGGGTIAMLFAAPLFAASKLLTKHLLKLDSSATVVAHLSIFSTLTMLVPALLVWQNPNLTQLFWLLGTALFATLSHLCLNRGLMLVDVTIAQPVEFLQLVWASLLGIVFFAEQPSLWVWLGAAVVVSSASFIARYEVKLRARMDDPG